MNSINQSLRWGKIRLVVTTKTKDERADLFVCLFVFQVLIQYVSFLIFSSLSICGLVKSHM